MKIPFLALSLLLVLNCLQAQVKIPAVDVDHIKMETKQNRVIKKTGRKNNNIVFVVHYPYNDWIKNMCSETKAFYDSVAIYYSANTITEFRFSEGSDRVYKTTWNKTAKTALHENYNENGKLEEKFTDSYISTSLLPAVQALKICDPDILRSGESYKYDNDGRELQYRNYVTGEGRYHDSTEGFAPDSLMYTLKAKADSIVTQSYGKAFFQDHIRLNFGNTSVYNSKSLSYERNNGMPDRWDYNTWHIRTSGRAITYMDFHYDIVFPGNVNFTSIITIRLNHEGKLVDAVDYGKVVHWNFTEGLMRRPVIDYLTPTGTIPYLKGKDLYVDGTADLKIIWKPDTALRTTGNLFYQLNFNKYLKKTIDCNMVYYDQVLINILTKELMLKKDIRSSECGMMASNNSREQENGKYGFRDSHGQTLIPFEYDELPGTLGLCNIARKGNLYGCISHKNEVIIPFQYQEITFVNFDAERFANDYVTLKKGGSYGLADAKGNIILPVKYATFTRKSDDKIAGVMGGKEVVTYDFRSKR
jgi:hypothetical protein